MICFTDKETEAQKGKDEPEFKARQSDSEPIRSTTSHSSL